MYIDPDYSNYKYLVESHDNFVTLSDKSHITVFSGDSKDLDVIQLYLNNGEILEDNITFTSSSSFTDISSNFSFDLFSLGYAPFYFLSSCFVILFIIFIINSLTKLFKKGGIFGSN